MGKRFYKSIFFLVIIVFFAANVFGQTRQSAQSLFAEGIEAEIERDWWTASESFQAAVRANPAYADAWYHLALCVYQMESYDLALEYIANAKKYSPGRTDILNLEGMIYISLGRFEDAENIFSGIQQKYPNDIDSRFGLAELNLFKGRITVAQKLYNDALGKSPGNIKALLSLALISSELGKPREAERYITKAMAFGPSDPQVYYIASYLNFKNGNIPQAEKRCLSAIQLNGDYYEAYSLLSLVYFAQGRFAEVIDLADFGISRDRNDGRPWYIKGLALHKLGRDEAAIDTWLLGLEAVPEDEIMRAAFELLVLKNLNIEDPRRAEWAKYHVQKASDYAKKYAGRSMRYEYQAALRLNPLDYRARNAFSNLMRSEGYSENYLSQIQFIQQNEILQGGIRALKEQGKVIAPEDEKYALVKLSDTVEGYESLLENTLASKWDVNPFFIEKTRWNIGLYYTDSSEPLYHPELNRVAAENLAILFRGVLGQSVNVDALPSANFSAAYADAYKKGYDYFIMLKSAQSERDLKFDAVMYSARTGTETKKFSSFKTGNDSYAASLLGLRAQILDALPIRAKILERSGNDILVDIGRTEGIVKDARFAVVKRGKIRTADAGPGLYYKQDDFLGIVTLTNISEDISEGVLSDTGFYDRVNARDDLVLVELPDNKGEGNSLAADRAPGADQKGNPVLNNPLPQKEDALRGAASTTARTSALIDMIRGID